jgi:hypothetical protein
MVPRGKKDRVYGWKEAEPMRYINERILFRMKCTLNGVKMQRWRIVITSNHSLWGGFVRPHTHCTLPINIF